MTVMLKDEPGPPTSLPPASPSAAHTNLPKPLSSRALPEQLLVGWRLERCRGPLPALPPPSRYKARLGAAVAAAGTRTEGQVVPQRLLHPREEPMSCWMPGCPALSMCRGLAALPITCLER